MEKRFKILMLEDNVVDAEIIQQSLLKENPNWEFKLVMTEEDYVEALESFQPDLILSDNTLPQFDASKALEIFKQRSLPIPFILVTGTVSEEFAVSIIKAGADDYILKDRLTRLPAAIEVALNQRKVEKEIADYRYALDQSAIVAITDQKGIILYANENFCKISKYTVEELVGQDHRIINSGYHPASYIKNLWQTIANGKIWRNEFCNKAKDGSLYWVDTTIVPFLNQDGKPYQYLSIRIDITEKKKTASQLQISEENYRTIMERVSDAFVAIDKNWCYTYVNKQAGKILNSKPEELVGRDIRKEFPEGIDQPFYKAYHRAMVEQQYIHLEEYYHPFNIWLENHIYPSPEGLSIFFRDITERKKADILVKQSEQKYRTIFSKSPLPKWIYDSENLQFLEVNESAVKHYGYTQEEFLSKSLKDIRPAEDVELLMNDLDKIKEVPDTRHGHWRHVKKNGEVIIVETTAHEIDYNSRKARMVVINDITERVEAEENLRILEQKILEQKIQEQKKIARAIIKGQEKERNYIGQELHDNINQILAGTKMYLSIAGKKNEEAKEIVKYPIELVDSSIEEIRLLCKKLVTPLKDINLEELIRDLINILDQNTIKTAFTYAVPDQLLYDDLKLNIYRIIQEQINNIIKYAKAKIVNISVKKLESAVSIIVNDDGKGFDVNSKRKGIGISNMINRVETFNGSVEIRSEPGKGCKISVSIPY